MIARYRFGLPFRFVREGVSYICCWHPNWDRTHPDNAGASHGCCDNCARTWRQGA
jgi:hypothetical protein